MSYLSKAFVNTLSSMAFIDATETEEHTDKHQEVGYKLTILRPFAEEVFVFFPRKVVSEMVENMFGGQDNVHSPEIVNDCVAEFLNVLAGNYFQMATPDKLFELGLPQSAKPNEVSSDYQSIGFKTVHDQIISVYHKLEV